MNISHTTLTNKIIPSFKQTMLKIEKLTPKQLLQFYGTLCIYEYKSTKYYDIMLIIDKMKFIVETQIGEKNAM